MSFFEELKRRNVFRVGIGYIVLAWVLLQVTDVVVPMLALPEWVGRLVLFLIAIGFPLVLFFAWAFELTPEGLKREKEVDRSRSITTQTGKKLDRAIIGILVIAVVFLVFDRIRQDRPAESDTTAVTETADKSVAVLPFLAMSSGLDDEYFADGLTEEILNSLAQLPELLVTARTSAFTFKGKDVPIAEIASALGVQHVVEGSVRRSGERLRVTAQLIRANDGFHLWSQNYDRDAKDTIAVQETIAEEIAVALNVVLDEDKREAMRLAGLKDVEAFVEYQKGRDLFEKAHGVLPQIATLRRANKHFENVVKRVASYGPAYVEHSDLFAHILLNHVTGQPLPGVSEADIEGALQGVIDDYSAAVQHARSPQERNAWEFDLAMISGNWRGLSGRFEHVLNDRGCSSGNWLAPMALVFGHASRFLPRARELQACDPMATTTWFTSSRAALWAGDPDLAIRTARKGLQNAPNAWLQHALIRALVATGKFDEAESFISEQMQFDVDIWIARMFVAAARGDTEEASRRFQTYQQDAKPSDFYSFLQYAWMGDRDNVNRIAAEIDQNPVRHYALTLLAYWCACGAPFDLDVTPNYAAKLEEAGLPWPPASPINFPLKDW